MRHLHPQITHVDRPPRKGRIESDDELRLWPRGGPGPVDSIPSAVVVGVGRGDEDIDV